MSAAPCRIAACLPLYVDGLCIQSHVLPSAFKTVCPLLKHCGGAFLLHTGVSQDGVASGWRFSRWRRFRISMKSQQQGSRKRVFSFGNVPDAEVERLAKKFKANPKFLDMTRRRCYENRSELWSRLSVTSMVGTYEFEHVSFTKLLKEVTQFGPWRAELQKLFW